MRTSRLNQLKSTFLLATSMLALGTAGAAFAQNTAANSGGIEEVVVTGTHLQTGFSTPTPVTAVGPEEMDARAPSTISDVVNELPMMRQTTGNTQAPRGNGSGGQNLIDLRGLGTSRTLVLVDGARFVPISLGGAIDVNLIPTNLVSRVDVVTGGASAAYGSDAVAGVVNFLIKDHINGLQGSLQYGQSQQGDNIEPALSFSAGTDLVNDSVHVVIGGDWSHNNGVGTIYSRPDTYGKEQGCLVTTPTVRDASEPASLLVPNCTWSTQATGGLIVSGPLKGIAFGVGGVPYNFNYGRVLSTLMYGGLPNPEDPHSNPNGNWLLEAPHYRYNALAKVTWDLNADTHLWFMYNYGHNEQKGLSSIHQQTALTILRNNPFIPASIQAAMDANKLTSIVVGEDEQMDGGKQFWQSDTVHRGVVGMKGRFGDWTWDFQASHGQSQSPAPLLTNLYEGNFLAAIYAVPGANGAPVCGPISTNPNLGPGTVGSGYETKIAPGPCVPYNIFGPTINVTQKGDGKGYNIANENPVLYNNPSASLAAVEALVYPTLGGTNYQTDDASINVQGAPFDDWAGPVSVAAGFEHRRSGGNSYCDPLSTLGYALTNNCNVYAGSFQVDEGYVEVGIPLAKDMPWAEALDMDIAIRETDYSLQGYRTTYKIGLNYQPVDYLRFRASRSRDVREPSISDLFSPISTGITATFTNPINHISGPEYTISGGNPNLKPEVATSWTAGVIFTPSWGNAMDGMNVSVDYYSVSIHGAIGSVSAAQTAQFCANGVQLYCQFVDPTGGPGGGLAIHTQSANLNLQHTDGFDFEVAYPVPLDSMGLPGGLNLRWLTTFTNSLKTISAVSTVEYAGSGVGGGVSKWRSNLILNYNWGPTLTNVQVRFTGALLADATLCGPGQACYNPAAANSTNINQYPSSYYVDLTETYKLGTVMGGDTQLFFNVQNLLDKGEPALGLIAFAVGGDPYDKIGRTFKLGLRFQF